MNAFQDYKTNFRPPHAYNEGLWQHPLLIYRSQNVLNPQPQPTPQIYPAPHQRSYPNKSNYQKSPASPPPVQNLSPSQPIFDPNSELKQLILNLQKTNDANFAQLQRDSQAKDATIKLLEN